MRISQLAIRLIFQLKTLLIYIYYEQYTIPLKTIVNSHTLINHTFIKVYAIRIFISNDLIHLQLEVLMI